MSASAASTSLLLVTDSRHSPPLGGVKPPAPALELLEGRLISSFDGKGGPFPVPFSAIAPKGRKRVRFESYTQGIAELAHSTNRILASDTTNPHVRWLMSELILLFHHLFRRPQYMPNLASCHQTVQAKQGEDSTGHNLK